MAQGTVAAPRQEVATTAIFVPTELAAGDGALLPLPYLSFSTVLVYIPMNMFSFLKAQSFKSLTLGTPYEVNRNSICKGRYSFGLTQCSYSHHKVDTKHNLQWSTFCLPIKSKTHFCSLAAGSLWLDS